MLSGNREDSEDAYVCHECGEVHRGMPLDFSIPAPDLYAGMSEDERANRALISSDQCIVDDRYFYIRGRLELPIKGTEQCFCFGVWSFVKRESFDEMTDSWTTVGRENERGPYPGLLANALREFPNAYDLPLRVVVQPVGVRPLLFIEEPHPLSEAQRDGVTMHRAAELSRLMLAG